MIGFTKQERTVLSIFAVILTCGFSFNYISKKYPKLNNLINAIDTDKLCRKIDINTASEEELIAIPYIGSYTAKNIIHYREEKGAFLNIEQIKNVKGIRDKNYEKFKKYIEIKK